MATKTKSVAAPVALVSPANAMAAAMSNSHGMAQQVALDGWLLGVAEANATQSAANAIAANTDDIAELYFGYGYTMFYLVLRNDKDAISAAQLDNPGWMPILVNGKVTNFTELKFGDAMLAHGRYVVKEGGKLNKTGKLVKGAKHEHTDLEGKAVAASAQAWRRISATDEEKAAAKAKRAARQTSGDADKKTDGKIKLEDVPSKAKDNADWLNLVYALLAKAEALGKNDAGHAIPAVASKINELASDLRKRLEEGKTA